MAYSVTLDGYDLTEYLAERPLVRVQLSSVSGGLIIPETNVRLRHVDKLFSGETAPFNACVDAPIVIAYNGGTIFNGIVTAFTDTENGTTLTCQAALARALRAVASLEVTATTPADAAKQILTAVGITCDASFDEAAAVYAAAGGLINCYVAVADNTQVVDVIGKLADLATADVYVRDNVAYWQRYVDSNVGYTVTDLLSVPTVSNDGAAMQYGAYSLRHLYDGQVPATGGSGKPTWTADYGNTQQVQIVGSASAAYYGALRIAARATLRPVYTFQAKPSALPILPGEWYTIDDGILDGQYRMTGYTTVFPSVVYPVIRY